VIVICDPSPDERARLAERIGETTQHLEAATIAQVQDELQRSANRPAVIVLGPGLDRADVLAFAEKADRDHGGVGTLLVMERLDASLLREALRSGIDDVLTGDAEIAEWAEAVQRVQARLASEDPDGDAERRRGKIVTVFSTKGGCGKSLVASNLAVLAGNRLGKPVALVDLDLQSGDLSIMLQLMPALSIFDAAGNVDRLDAEALAGYFTPHRSGVKLLAAPVEPSLSEQITPDAVTTILGMLPDMFPLTIIDSPPLFTDQVLAALDLTDEIVIIGSMDVPSIKNLRLAITTLSRLGHPRDQLHIVLNRADSKVGLRTAEVEKSLGLSVDVQIPSSRDVPLSINQGSPLAVSRPKSPVVAAINELAVKLVPEAAAGKRGRRR